MTNKEDKTTTLAALLDILRQPDHAQCIANGPEAEAECILRGLAYRGVRVAPSHPSPGESAGFDAEVERVAALLHDEYGCRITCRGGRLADDRHPSHNEAYRDQAERLVAVIGDEHE